MTSLVRVIYQGREVWMDLETYMKEYCEGMNRKIQGGHSKFTETSEVGFFPDLTLVRDPDYEDDCL